MYSKVIKPKTIYFNQDNSKQAFLWYVDEHYLDWNYVQFNIFGELIDTRKDKYTYEAPILEQKLTNQGYMPSPSDNEKWILTESKTMVDKINYTEKVVEKEVITTVKEIAKTPESVTLSFSIAETLFLRDLLAKVGGCQHTSLRKYADNLITKLDKIGFKDSFYNTYVEQGTIYFKDDSVTNFQQECNRIIQTLTKKV